MLGGIGGHAGLFSNAKDVATIMQMYLQNGVYNNKRYFSGQSSDLGPNTYSITEDNAGNIWAIRGVNGIWIKKKNEEKFKYQGSYNENLRNDKSFLARLTQGHLTYDKNLIIPSERTVWLADKIKFIVSPISHTIVSGENDVPIVLIVYEVRLQLPSSTLAN